MAVGTVIRVPAPDNSAGISISHNLPGGTTLFYTNDSVGGVGCTEVGPIKSLTYAGGGWLTVGQRQIDIIHDAGCHVCYEVVRKDGVLVGLLGIRYPHTLVVLG